MAVTRRGGEYKSPVTRAFEELGFVKDKGGWWFKWANEMRWDRKKVYLALSSFWGILNGEEKRVFLNSGVREVSLRIINEGEAQRN